MNALLSSDHEGTHHLVVQKLHAHYGKVCALHDISFQMQCGSMIALVGGNGAGKTTLMKSIVGLVPATTGQILWQDRPVKQGIPEIAYLPQRQDVDWRFPITVRGLIEMGRYARLGAFRPMGKPDHAAVDEAIEAMQLQKLARRQIGALSGGQQQRAFIARALAQEAHVLLLDEPFAGLDHPSTQMLGALLRALARHGRLVMASHHDLASLEMLFDEVVLMNRRLIARGQPVAVMQAEFLKEAFGG